MIVNEAFVYELDPTPEQIQLLWRHCGLARYVFNWALGMWNDSWQKNKDKPKAEREKRPSAYDLSLRWTAKKKADPEIKWTYDLMSNTASYAIKAADNGFKHFFRRLREGNGGKYGHPRFKARGKGRDSFTIQEQNFRADPKAIKIGKLGMVRTKQYVLETDKYRAKREQTGAKPTRHLDGRVLRIAVSRRADRWYASIMVERDRPDPLPVRGPVTGVDFGIHRRITTSDGFEATISDRLEKRLKQLAHLNRLLDRKRRGPRKGTSNRYKLRMRIARLHKEIANVRGDQIHKLSHRLATTSSMIVVEGFEISNLVEKRRKKIRGFNKARARRRIYDAAWGELRRQLAYKTKWYGSELVITDAFDPSDRQCHQCGHVNDPAHVDAPPTNDFHCGGCDLRTTRQINTALRQRKIGEAQSA